MSSEESKRLTETSFPDWDRLRERDPGAWQELIDFLRPSVMNHLGLKFGSTLRKEDIEDISAGVLADAYHRLDKVIQGIDEQTERVLRSLGYIT